MASTIFSFLTKKELNYLCFMAYCGDSINSTSLSRYKKILGLEDSDVKKMNSALVYKYNFAKRQYDYYYSYSIMVEPKIYFKVLYFLYKEHYEWVSDFSKISNKPSEIFCDMRDSVQNIVKGYDNVFIISSLHANVYLDYFIDIVKDKTLRKLANMLPDSIMTDYIERIIVSYFTADRTDYKEALTDILDGRKNINAEDRKYINELVALYNYYATGEYKPAGNGKSLFDCILRGIKALHDDDNDSAMVFLQKALKIRNKNSDIKNVFYNPLTCYFLISLYIRKIKEGGRTKLEQFTNKKDIYWHLQLLPSYILAKSEIDEDHEVNLLDVNRLHIYSESEDNKIYKIFCMFLCKALDIQSLSINKEDWNYVPNNMILRHEFSDFLNLSEEEKNELNNIYGKKALGIKKSLAKWEKILNDLEENADIRIDDNIVKVEKQERICYQIVSNNYIQAKYQTRLKSGKWNSGRNISGSAYYNFMPCMDEKDKNICVLNNRNITNLSVGTVLPFLIGEDRVYQGRYAPFKSVSIEKEDPYLIIDKKKDKFVVSSNIKDIERGKKDYVIKKHDTNYSVISLNDVQAVFFEKLLILKEFPLDAEARLRDFIGKICNLIEIHSEELTDNTNMETLEGDERIVLQIIPSQANRYNVNIFSRPLANGKNLQIPGKGLALIVDQGNGVKYQIKRKLKNEKENKQEVVAFIEDCTGKPIYDSNSVTMEAFQLLEFLKYIMENHEKYILEWPEGEKIRIKGLAKDNAWNIKLREVSNWFEIEGNVTTDDNMVMNIANLMELSRNRIGNYIQLNNDEFLLLTESLQKQLEKLDAITVNGHNGMHISKMHSGLLADILSNGITAENSDNVKIWQDKIHKSFELSPNTPRTLKAKLRDYQLDGFRWMARLDSWGAGACLADDMGLGKTVQTIAMLLYKAKLGASLIVAPTSVISNWRNEINRFAPSLNVFLINEGNSDERKIAVEQAKENDIILTTYGILVKESDTITEKKWNIVCLDEAHTIKNRDTQMAQTAVSLQADTRIALTGTPLQNHLGELWSLFNFINQGMLGGYEEFQRKFITPIESGDKQRQLQLKKMIMPFILRRTKKEVVDELPDKTEVISYVELSKEEMNTYEMIRIKAKKQLEEEEKVSVSVLAEITKLRQAACSSSLVNESLNFTSSKIEQLMELVEDTDGEDNHILIFSQFTSFLKLVRDEFDKNNKKYLYLDGSTPLKKREKLVKQFQEGEVPIFIISLKAGGLGLNLTEANYVIHCDPWWNPAIEQQATDRAYRIGQELKVTVYHLISQHTIEEKILKLHHTKIDMAEALLNGSNMSHKLTEKQLMEILSSC